MNMAAIEGFELTIATDDTVVAMGTIDGVAVAGGTIDSAADSDGDHLVVYTGSGFDHVATQLAAHTVLGTATVATNAVTAVSYDNRGRDLPASA
jgi:hypothetical protein